MGNNAGKVQKHDQHDLTAVCSDETINLVNQPFVDWQIRIRGSIIRPYLRRIAFSKGEHFLEKNKYLDKKRRLVFLKSVLDSDSRFSEISELVDSHISNPQLDSIQFSVEGLTERQKQIRQECIRCAYLVGVLF